MTTNRIRFSALGLAGALLCGVASLPLTASAAAKPHAKHPAKKHGKPTKSAASGGAAAAGKKIYMANGCAGCHAIGGTGGTTGPNLTKVAAEASHSAAWLKDAVINPKAHNPNSTMPAYDDKIKGSDLSNLVAYLRTLK